MCGSFKLKPFKERILIQAYHRLRALHMSVSVNCVAFQQCTIWQTINTTTTHMHTCQSEDVIF